jgi:hypothetical protein
MLAVVLATGILTAVSQVGAPQAGASAPPSPTIYFVHVGESDKPLWPVVLSTTPPDATALARFLPEPLWRQAGLFILSVDDVQRVEAMLRPYQTADVSPADRTPAAYGSFRVTLVSQERQEHLLLRPEQAKSLLQEIFTRIAPTYPPFQSALKTLLQRLGVAMGEGQHP